MRKILMIIFASFSLISCDNDNLADSESNDVCLIKTFVNEIYPKYPYIKYSFEDNGKYEPFPTSYTNQYYKYKLTIRHDGNDKNEVEKIYNDISRTLLKNNKITPYNEEGIYNDEFSGNAFFSENSMQWNSFIITVFCNHNVKPFNN